MKSRAKRAEKNERNTGINTLAYLFLQVFFAGRTYEDSIMRELRWVVKELAAKEPDVYLQQELKRGLQYGHYADSRQDAVFAFAMQRMTESYHMQRQTAKKACVRLQELLEEAKKKEE